MSRKRKIDDVKSAEDEEQKDELQDFELKFKMTKKTPQSGKRDVNQKIRKPMIEAENISNKGKHTRMDLESDIAHENNANSSTEDKSQRMIQGKGEKKDPKNYTPRVRVVVEEEPTKQPIIDWLQQKASQKTDTEESQSEPSVRSVPRTKFKGGTGIKFYRDRGEIEDILDDYEHIERKVELGDGKIPVDNIIISSWNVNGLKRLLKKDDLQRYMKEKQLDMICMSETKLADVEFDEAMTNWIPEGYTGIFNCCKIRNGYSGTAIITKYKPISVAYDIGVKRHDLEGRTITAEFEKFYLVATYWPNAGINLVGHRYRHEEWDPDFRKYVVELKKKKHVVICGDLNIIHLDIDRYDPSKSNEKVASFTPEERKNFNYLLDSGFVDTFRHLHPDSREYSYYSISMQGVRHKTKGWRLDYFLIDTDGMRAVRDAMIQHEVYGSNHLPVEIILDPQFGRKS